MNRYLMTLSLILSVSGAYVETYASIIPGAPEISALTVLNDNQIIQILLLMSESEVATGKVAMTRASLQEVDDFGEMMAVQHRNIRIRTKNISIRERLKKQNSDLSLRLKAEAKATLKDLKTIRRDSFDLTYINQQVLTHEFNLKMFDEILLPSVLNEVLKVHLDTTREKIVQHLAALRLMQP